MALTKEITEVTVKDAGGEFKGKMHRIFAKLTLKDAEIVIFEQTFSENHKDIYSISDTMEKIRIQMDGVKKKIETELALKIEAEKEVPTMLANLAKGDK